VAWLTVRWALARYKREKTWERQFTAYVDVVNALSTMRLMTGQWIDDLENHRSPSSRTRSLRRERYLSAKQQFEESVGVASLLLSKESATTLVKLDRDLEAIGDQPDEHGVRMLEYSYLDDAIHALIRQGRSRLA